MMQVNLNLEESINFAKLAFALQDTIKNEHHYKKF